MSKAIGVLGSLMRLSLACLLLWTCWQDWPAIQARAGFDALPETFDYWKEADALLNQERFSEALLVADAGLAAAPVEQHRALTELKGTIVKEQGRWMFRFQQVGRGALTGTGESVEALGGAVVADLFVFGDVRDLVIQGGKRLRGEAVDPIIVGLSAGGILMTVNPAVDLGGALLKFARRMGGMTADFAKALGDAIRRAVATRNADEVAAISDDVAALSKQARPAVALAILKHVDDPATLKAAREFTERPGGTFALWLGQREALRWLKASPGNADIVLKAARRGRAGFAYLAQNSAVMFRAHPLIGLLKGLYKGNVPALLMQLARQWTEAILGFTAGWAAYEVALLLGRLAAPGARAIRPELASSG
ncbi:MAG TPA: hypothetical protein VM240_05240 [Verrucomicrobiae bacterium]|nr:hypothetical protein [Verrucomicrobiae bacterium]